MDMELDEEIADGGGGEPGRSSWREKAGFELEGLERGRLLSLIPLAPLPPPGRPKQGSPRNTSTQQLIPAGALRRDTWYFAVVCQDRASLAAPKAGLSLSTSVTNCIAAESSGLTLGGLEIRLQKNLPLPEGTARTKPSAASLTAFGPFTPFKQSLPSQSQTADGLRQLEALSNTPSTLRPPMQKQTITQRTRRAYQ